MKFYYEFGEVLRRQEEQVQHARAAIMPLEPGDAVTHDGDPCTVESVDDGDYARVRFINTSVHLVLKRDLRWAGATIEARKV